MGIKLHVDLETNQGPTNQLYIRIDTWKVNNTVGEIRFTTTSWLDKSYGDKFLRNYMDEPLNNAVGLVSSKVVYYSSSKSEGEEVEIPNLYTFAMYQPKEIEVDILEEQKVSKEVPYVSFDEEGNEVTLFRTVTTTENVKVGSKIENKKVMDYTIPLTDLGVYSYNFLESQLAEVFPADKIERLN